LPTPVVVVVETAVGRAHRRDPVTGSTGGPAEHRLVHAERLRPGQCGFEPSPVLVVSWAFGPVRVEEDGIDTVVRTGRILAS
jgi:hypothetical protein